jgi:ornithine cyclodeaminase/alanine dehydrogenase-like protein (mu-crystallin family)
MDQISVVDLTGVAVQDLVIAEAVLKATKSS